MGSHSICEHGGNEKLIFVLTQEIVLLIIMKQQLL